MKLSEIKSILSGLEELHFTLEDGTAVPEHFHVTEIGQIDKKFIDCGGTIRTEKAINFQLWYSVDQDHRLEAQKLRKIIQISEEQLHLEDATIEVEYQQGTIGKFGLDFNGKAFVLTTKKTTCLAQEACGVPTEKIKVNKGESSNSSCCAPNSGCC